MTELSFGMSEVSFLLICGTNENLQKNLWQKCLFGDRSGFFKTEVTFVFLQKQKCPFHQNLVSEVSFALKGGINFSNLGVA